MSRPVLASLAAIASAMLACGPTHAAGVTRAWVSGRGTDAAGCGAPVNPCRSLQYAHDNIAPGGEIDILDPAGYGAITITKAISIVNDGVGTAGVQQATSGADAITIDAGPSDAVTLRGLNIDGLGVAKDGIGLTEAGKLTIVNCVVRHFTHDGLYLQQANGVLFLTVFNTMAADNSNDGFDISPGAQGTIGGVLDHAAATTNGSNGVVVWGADTTGINGADITVANSDVSTNGNAGIYVKGNSVRSTLVNVRDVISDETFYGYYLDDHGLMNFMRSEALSDATPVFVSSTATGYTFGDNYFPTGPILTKMAPE
jgi:hypothetical protein